MGRKANWLNLSQTQRNDEILKTKIDLWAAHAGENLKTRSRMGDDLKVFSGILKTNLHYSWAQDRRSIWPPRISGTTRGATWPVSHATRP